jgi:hypothetical protein
MPKFVKNGRWGALKMERAPEVAQICDAGLTAAPSAYVLQKLPKETFRLVLWVQATTLQATTLPTKSETATYQIKSRAACFSKVRVSEA